MSPTFKIGNTEVGPGQPIYIVGEIGINHNGDIDVVKKLVDVAAELCVPWDQWDIERDTPRP